jgi:hypothetical protein
MTLQDLLGHSSIVVTVDTYASVPPVVQRRCANADATAKLVLAAACRTATRSHQRRPERPDPRSATGAPAPTRPTQLVKKPLGEQG